MTEVKLTLNDTQIQDAISVAIMAQLTPEAKERVIAAAVKQLIEPVRSSGYGSSGLSPLQQAFNLAVNDFARQEAAALVRQDAQFQAALKEAMAEVMADCLKDNERFIKALTAAALNVIAEIRTDRYA